MASMNFNKVKENGTDHGKATPIGKTKSNVKDLGHTDQDLTCPINLT